MEFGLCGFVQITRGLRAGHLSRQAMDESAVKLTPDGSGVFRQNIFSLAPISFSTTMRQLRLLQPIIV